MRRWERRQEGAPFDQQAEPQPSVDSPYARPRADNPPVLPERPGQTRYVWGVVLLVCATLALVAGLAT